MKTNRIFLDKEEYTKGLRLQKERKSETCDKQSSFEGLGGRNEWTVIRMNKLWIFNLFVSPFRTWVQEGLGPVPPAEWEKAEAVIDSSTKPISNGIGSCLQGKREMLFQEK